MQFTLPKIKSTSFKKSLKRAVSFLLTFALVGSLGSFWSLKTARPVEAVWLDESWAYRKAVPVNNSSGSEITNYQLLITLDTTSLYSSGKVQGDCDDIRVTDISGALLPHWVEENDSATPCNSTSTKIWVKVPSIPTSGTTLFLYYGNPQATNIEAPESVFEFFDDFNGTTLDTNKWQQVGSGTVNLNSGKAVSTGSKIIWSTSNITNIFDKQIELRGKLKGVSGQDVEVGFGYLTGSNLWRGTRTGEWITAIGWSSHGTTIANGLGTEDCFNYVSGELWDYSNYFNYRARFVANHGWVWKEGVNILDQTASCSQTNTSLPLFFAFGHGSNYTEYLDWILVRKYVSTEPTIGTLGNEESQDSPIAWWKFDEGYGQTTQDSTINNLDATLGANTSQGSDDPTWQTEDMCAVGKCFYFDGGDYLNISHQSVLNAYPLTISAWIRTGVNDNYERGIVNKYVAGSYNGYQLYIRNGKLQGWYFRDSSNYIRTDTYGGERFIADNKWHFVSFVVDSSGGKLYIDGVLKLSISWTGSAGAVTTTQALNIGRYGGGSGSFIGFIDDVKIYNQARTLEQIKASFKNAGTRTTASAYLGSGSSSVPWASAVNQRFISDGMVGYWRMDEDSWTNDCSTATVMDASGNGNHGKSCPASSGPTGAATGKYDKAGNFDGADDYVDLGDSADLRLPRGNKITLLAWFQSTAASRGWIINKRTSGASDVYGVALDNGPVTIYFRGSDNSGVAGVQSGGVYNDGKWHFIAAVYDTSSGQFKLFLDGILRASGIYNLNTDIAMSGNLNIGKQLSSEYFTGLIDEVRIYNRALSEDEVKALYKWAPGPVGYWKFDEGSGYYVQDYSGYDTTLYLNIKSSVNPHPWVKGRYGRAWWKAGYEYPLDEEARATCGTLCWKPGRQKSFTVSIWVKPESDPPNPTYSPWIASRWWGYSDSYPAGWAVGYSNSTRKVTFWVCKDNQCSQQGSVVSNSALPTDAWSHIAAVHKDGESIAIYINGKLEGEASYTLGLNPTPPRIAFGSNANNNWVSFKGAFDEAKVYNYARTPEQILEDMNAGHPAGGSPNPSELLYYKLDEGYGTTALNSGNTGATLNGTLNNFASPATSTSGWQMSGKFGKGLAFDGANDYLSAPDNNALSFGNGSSDSPFSVAFWVKFTSTASQGLLAKYSMSNREYQIYTDSSGRIYAVLWDESAGAYIGRYSSSGPPSGQWSHIAITYDGSASPGGIKIYLNSKRIDSTNYTSGTYTAMENLTAPLSVGQAGTYYLGGQMDEIKMYNFALSEDQVKVDYNRGGAVTFAGLNVWGDEGFGGAPPIAEWKFEERSGTTANDTSGQAHTGTLVNGPAWVRGIKGYALSFDGVNDYVNAGDSDAFTFTGDFTISAWVYIKSPGVNFFRGIVSKAGYDGGREWELGYDPSVSNKIRFLVGDSNGSWVLDMQRGGNISTNTWHHIVAQISNGQGRIFIDGIQSGDPASYASTMKNTASPVYIGGVYQYETSSPFNGFLDEVRIYNYALTPAQIAYDYSRGAPVGWWKFNECQGTSIKDSSGRALTGALNLGSGGQTSAGDCFTSGSTAWYNGRNGKFRSSLNFDGTDDYVDLNNASSSSYLKNKLPLSLSAWIKPNSFSSFPVIIALDEWTNTAYCGAILHLNTEGKPLVEYGSCTGGGSDLYRRSKTSDEAISTGGWHHIVGVIRGPTDMSIYIDGREVGGTYSGSGGDIGYSSVSSKIGTSSGGIKFFSGQIDDVRVYNYDLSTEMVRKIMNEGAAVRFGPLEGSP